MKRRDSRGACWPQRRLRAGAFRAGRLPKSGPRRRCLHCRSGGHLWRGSYMGPGGRAIWQLSPVGWGRKQAAPHTAPGGKLSRLPPPPPLAAPLPGPAPATDPFTAAVGSGMALACKRSDKAEAPRVVSLAPHYPRPPRRRAWADFRRPSESPPKL
jgi:hypothetical protein